LQAGIERELTRVNRARLAQASAQISSDYRQARFISSLATPESRAAYLSTRLPATFAANLRVFREVSRLMPGLSPQSLLDLGAGPGTAMWAAREVWRKLSSLTAIENNEELLLLGKRLTNDEQFHWKLSDLAKAEFPASDLVVISYALGELQSPLAIVNRAWQAAQAALIVIEPGTPRNFSGIEETRRWLTEHGGHPIAPCPHSNACPMAVAGDWCHFAVRVERSAEHRRFKGGELGYEDEKFSYLAFSKTPAPHAAARIVRHPQVHAGHIRLTLCTPQGLESPTVTRSQKDAFRAARKAKWGDEWNG
jgi:ribosomal protein RSM22 (predicted rRNA methylase)